MQRPWQFAIPDRTWFVVLHKFSWECPDFFKIPGSDKWVLKGSASGDWWSLGDYTEVSGQEADTFKPLSYDVHDGSTAGLGLQKYDFGQFYASK